MSRLTACASTLAITALLVACGSSSKSSTQATGTTGGATGGASATTASGTGGTGGAAPAVANATNLQTAPAPSAGTGAAPTTLVVKDLVVGTGQQAAATSTVRVQYVGANWTDGKVFDSSWSRGQPIDFALNQVIPGFAQGIVGMKVGGRRELVIPSALGYGAQGSPPAVGPNETLVFVIDLVAVQ